MLIQKGGSGEWRIVTLQGASCYSDYVTEHKTGRCVLLPNSQQILWPHSGCGALPFRRRGDDELWDPRPARNFPNRCKHNPVPWLLSNGVMCFGSEVLDCNSTCSLERAQGIYRLHLQSRMVIQARNRRQALPRSGCGLLNDPEDRGALFLRTT